MFGAKSRLFRTACGAPIWPLWVILSSDEWGAIHPNWCADCGLAGAPQCLQDSCLAWASEESGHSTLVCDSLGQLGNCSLWILVASACKSYRLHTVQCGIAQGHAVSHCPGGVCAVCCILSESFAQVGFSMSWPVHDQGCVFYFSWSLKGCLCSAHKRTKTQE